MLGQMVKVATECVKTPGRMSVWSERLGKYVCSDDPQYTQALEEQIANITAAPQPLSPMFKSVFLAVLGGTLLSMVLCVTLALAAGREPPPLADQLVHRLFDLAKIGFGAIVGLLGGRAST